MAGYVRQSAASIIPTADITAAPLNAEFNALENAFHSVLGHNHDGSPGNGAPLGLGALGGLEDMRVLGNASGQEANVQQLILYDEEDMASNSSIGLATQRSIKAYVDSRINEILALLN